MQGSFSQHDFHPLAIPAESSIWGRSEWRGTFTNLFNRTKAGKQYIFDAFDYVSGKGTRAVSLCGENLRPWIEHFQGLAPQIRAACEYLKQRQPHYAAAYDKILAFVQVTPLFR